MPRPLGDLSEGHLANKGLGHGRRMISPTCVPTVALKVGGSLPYCPYDGGTLASKSNNALYIVHTVSAQELASRKCTLQYLHKGLARDFNGSNPGPRGNARTWRFLEREGEREREREGETVNPSWYPNPNPSCNPNPN